MLTYINVHILLGDKLSCPTFFFATYYPRVSFLQVQQRDELQRPSSFANLQLHGQHLDARHHRW